MTRGCGALGRGKIRREGALGLDSRGWRDLAGGQHKNATAVLGTFSNIVHK